MGNLHMRQFNNRGGKRFRRCWFLLNTRRRLWWNRRFGFFFNFCLNNCFNLRSDLLYRLTFLRFNSLGLMKTGPQEYQQKTYQ